MIHLSKFYQGILKSILVYSIFICASINGNAQTSFIYNHYQSSIASAKNTSSNILNGGLETEYRFQSKKLILGLSVFQNIGRKSNDFKALASEENFWADNLNAIQENISTTLPRVSFTVGVAVHIN